jgi:two-component system, OmpR family, alkaline phosphatase synthesis response regulator PhoP
MRLLVVEDEKRIADFLSRGLQGAGYAVDVANDGASALDLIHAADYDLIILDLMLPGIDGLDVCRHLKANPKTQHIPVILLTARGQAEDIAMGMELGADDYITKPFSSKVLISRVRAMLRRRDSTREEFESILRRGSLVINPKQHEVIADGGVVDLTDTQFQLLYLLAQSPEKVFSRREILQAVFPDNAEWIDADVDTLIEDLRETLGSCGTYIMTVRSAGFQLANF